MRFIGENGDEIRDIEEWKRLGGPKESSQWKEGRSAYELANDWVTGRAQPRVEALLNSQLDGVELEVGFAEKKTRFDGYAGPRNHDLLIEASSAEGPVVIGVEGKADEPFDLSLIEKRVQARRSLDANPNSNALRRLDEMSDAFLGFSVEDLSAEDPRGDLGYQLLSSLAGTLADAKQMGASSAVLLVHEFVTSETEDLKHELNNNVYSAFVDLITDQSPRTKTEPGAWITPLIEVRGYGELMPATLPVAFAKLTTNVRG